MPKFQWDKIEDKTILIYECDNAIAYQLVLTLLGHNDHNTTAIHVIAMSNAARCKYDFTSFTGRSDFEFITKSDALSVNKKISSDYMVFIPQVCNNYKFTSEVNITFDILKLAGKWNIQVLSLVSSSSVYGKIHDEITSITEQMTGYNDHTLPASSDVTKKRIIETLCMNHASKTNCKVIIGRFAEVIDKSDYVKNESRLSKKSFTYAVDAANALLLMLLSGENKHIYNVCSNSISDFEKASPFDPYPDILDISKLINLGYTPEVSPKKIESGEI